MTNRHDIFVAVGIAALVGIAAWFHIPGGASGMAVVFAGMILAPGYLLARVFIEEPFDPWETYPLSLVLGVSLFGLVGMVMFLVHAPLWTAYAAMTTISIALAAWAMRAASPHMWERGWLKESGGLGIAFAVTVFVVALVALKLGSFRGWYMEWDYYTYIAMVRRIVSRGFAGNFPLSYADEGNDPIHSYNIWALMWAVISRGSNLDPVMLYVKSGFLMIPAAVLAFYALVKILFNRATAMAATICYAMCHGIMLGFITLGSSSFFNDDPAWLIFFPISIRFGWQYLEQQTTKRLILCLLAVVGTLMVHPLWGGLAAVGIALAALTMLLSEGGISKRFRWLTPAGWALLILPSIWALAKVAVGERYLGTIGTRPSWDLVIFFILPMLLFAPRIVELTMQHREKVRGAVYLLIGIAIVFAPFVLLRFHETRGARADIFELLHPYKWYVTDKLFVLNPTLFTYTEPDMTLYPWSLLVLLALPWLIVRERRGDRVAYFVAAAILLIPLVAVNPYLSWIYCRILHPAYLKRALRFSAIFAAVGAGAFLWAITMKAGRWAWGALVLLAVGLAAAASIYPMEPPYFRGALEKAWFIMKSPPGKGLFWAPEMDADVLADVKWDTEEFSKLLENIPLKETVVSDAFTSYRIPAYRDVYVMVRPKPSFAVNDQASRDEDYGKLVSAAGNPHAVCEILRKYRSRWILFNADPSYKLRGSLLWDPALIRTLLSSNEYFEPVGFQNQWGLVRAGEKCVP